jgi:putative addiction module killer protein
LNTIQRTVEFNRWLSRLSDRKAQARILARIVSAQHGNFGDSRSIGEGVSELRIDFGPGYRVYYTRQAETVYLLLAGGDKSTQVKDIKRARGMVRELKASGAR